MRTPESQLCECPGATGQETACVILASMGTLMLAGGGGPLWTRTTSWEADSELGRELNRARETHRCVCPGPRGREGSWAD